MSERTRRNTPTASHLLPGPNRPNQTATFVAMFIVSRERGNKEFPNHPEIGHTTGPVFYSASRTMNKTAIKCKHTGVLSAHSHTTRGTPAPEYMAMTVDRLQKPSCVGENEHGFRMTPAPWHFAHPWSGAYSRMRRMYKRARSFTLIREQPQP